MFPSVPAVTIPEPEPERPTHRGVHLAPLPGPRRAGATLLPGLLLAGGLGAFGIWASGQLGGGRLGLERSPISPVMIGIVLGMAVGNLASLPAATRPGLRFAATRVLRLGIILLGIRLSLFEIAKLGAVSVPIVVLCILFGILFTGFLSRRLSLPARLGTLIGVGTSICGVSAIVATGPAIDAEDEEVAYAVGVITVFGLLALVFYPYLAHAIFDGDPTAAGLFLGTAIHDTSQVNGAAMIYADVHGSPRALDVAVVTKLLRNLFMIAVIPIMAARYHRTRSDAGPSRVPLARMFPLFVLGFLAMAALRSVGDAGIGVEGDGVALGLWDRAEWGRLHGRIARWAVVCLVVALSAVGLGTDFRTMKRLGAKPLLVGLGAALAVGLVSFGAIRWLNPLP